MSKVTSKLQVTIPKAIAEKTGIKPGDEIAWELAGDVIRIRPAGAAIPAGSVEERLRIFREQARRQGERQRHRRIAGKRRRSAGRGWTREELYGRDQPR